MTKYEKMEDRFAKSGLDKDVLARKAGIKGSTLRYYLRRAKEIRASKDDSEESSEPEFMAIDLGASTHVDREITITMPGGLIIRVPIC
ncbi:MAG: hypothetical protein J5I64_06065 [Saprospiraceae bacterium]|nr:hypothetical protein [Saprospiraceae bacterium]